MAGKAGSIQTPGHCPHSKPPVSVNPANQVHSMGHKGGCSALRELAKEKYSVVLQKHPDAGAS